MIDDMMNRVRNTQIRVVAAFQSWNDGETGASMVEYVLLVSFIAIAAVFAVALVGQSLNAEYDSISDSVTNYGR
jgi:Flp pilus assembly pilin Flp